MESKVNFLRTKRKPRLENWRRNWVFSVGVLSTYCFRVFVSLVGILSVVLVSTRWKVGDGMSGFKG